MPNHYQNLLSDTNFSEEPFLVRCRGSTPACAGQFTTAISRRKSNKRLGRHEHSCLESSDPGRRFPPGIIDPKWTSNLRWTRNRKNLVFRTFEISSLTPRTASKPLVFKPQHLLHFGDCWHTSCVIRFRMRIAFDNVNKKRDPSANALVENAGQES